MRVEVSQPPGLPPVRAPYGRVVQVLVNLIVNAADALDACAPRRTAPRVTLHAEVSEGVVRLYVDDNGPGIANEALEKILEPFFTTKAPGKGTGLGLPLSREYAVRWGGELRAENREEGGARFTLVIPRAAVQRPAADNAVQRAL